MLASEALHMATLQDIFNDPVENKASKHAREAHGYSIVATLTPNPLTRAWMQSEAKQASWLAWVTYKRFIGRYPNWTGV